MPEDLRLDEQKIRKVQPGKPAGYELRSPKKPEKEKQSSSWWPFGRTRWQQATPTVKPAEKPAIKPPTQSPVGGILKQQRESISVVERTPVTIKPLNERRDPLESMLPERRVSIPMTPEISKPVAVAGIGVQAAKKKRRGFWSWLKFTPKRRALRARPPMPEPTPPAPLPPSSITLSVPTGAVAPIPSAATVIRPAEKIVQKAELQTPPLPDKAEETAARVARQRVNRLKNSLPSWLHVPEKTDTPGNLPEGSTVNLIPGHSSLRSWRRIGLLCLSAAVMAAVFIGIMYGLLQFWQTQIESQVTTIDREIEGFNNKITVYKNFSVEMSEVGKQIALVDQMLNRHVYWTHFFALLEKYTLQDVYYDGLSAGMNGNITLSAHGRSYQTVSQQLLLLLSDEAKEFALEARSTSASLSSTAKGGEQVDFSIQLTLNPKLFFYPEETNDNKNQQK